jgi:hypothetical protein
MRRKFLLALGIAAVMAGPGAGVARADFVCPILPISDQAAENGKRFTQLPNGDYTIIGPNVNVPDHATNQDGAGSPEGAHAGPGDPGYSPIWNTP